VKEFSGTASTGSCWSKGHQMGSWFTF